MTELKQLRDFAEQVNGVRPTERSLKGVVNNLIKNYQGGGTQVVANPELEGTEADLTGLQVGETKYKVPKQNFYYEHHVTLTGSANCLSFLTIVNDDYHPFDDYRNNIVNYLSSKGFVSTDTSDYTNINAYPVSGTNYGGQLFVGVTVYNGSLYPVINGSYGPQVSTDESLSFYKDIVNG